MAMYPIATYTMAAGQPTFVDFLNIPQIYEDLQVRYVTRDTQALSTRGMFLEINGGASFLRGQHRITTTSNGTSVGASNDIATTTRFDWIDIPAGSAPANVFSSGIIDFSNYANTSQLKTIELKAGYVDGLNVGMLYHQAMLWSNTAAITSLKIYTNQAFAVGSSLTLYGITGSEL